jgi:hypothetical protein
MGTMSVSRKRVIAKLIVIIVADPRESANRHLQRAPAFATAFERGF